MTLKPIAALMLLAAPLSAQTALPIGSRGSGTTSTDAPAEFRFTPPSPGILTIVVRASDDVTIRVVDEDGQELPQGTADNDNNGSTGLEFLAVPLGQADPVRVQVTLLAEEGGNGGFTISASFIAEEGFARPGDSDRRPSLARALNVGTAIEDAVNPDEGDMWDWYVIRATEAMTVTVVTRMAEGTEGDLVIEAFTAGNYIEPVAQSDQDMQGHTGNESVTVTLKTGDVLHVKVAALGGSGGNAPYRISVARQP